MYTVYGVKEVKEEVKEEQRVEKDHRWLLLGYPVCNAQSEKYKNLTYFLRNQNQKHTVKYI